MKNYYGSVVKVEPGYLPPAMPLPGPIKMEPAYIPTHPFIHHPQPLQPLQFPLMMPRSYFPASYPPAPVSYHPSSAPIVPRPVKVEFKETAAMFETQSEPPVLDLSVKKARRDSTVSNMSVISDHDPVNLEDTDQSLDLSCPEKQNGGKTFKKALLNRYHSKYMSVSDFKNFIKVLKKC